MEWLIEESQALRQWPVTPNITCYKMSRDYAHYKSQEKTKKKKRKI